MRDATINSGINRNDNYDGSGESVSDYYQTLATSDCALAPALQNGTGTHMLTTTLDLRNVGVETGQVSVSFQMQLPHAPILSNGSGGFPILVIGAGAAGTITLQYLPVSGGGAPHMFEASITGDINRIVTARPSTVGSMVNVYLEYDGADLLLIVGNSSGTYHSSTAIAPPTSPVAFSFGANAPGTAYNDLTIFNTVLTPNVQTSATNFPFMLWDAAGSGVIAQLPVTPVMGTYYTFIDTGFHVGHLPAQCDLTSASAVPATVTLYVNEQPVTLTWTGGTAAQFVTWLTSTNGGIVSFPFDSLTEHIQFTATGATTFTAAHIRAGVLGQMSFSIRFEGGITGGKWSETVAIIGKVPQQFYQPHTGKLNSGVSMLGATKTITTPKSISLQRRDDQVRTVGRIIGDINNRPVAQSVLTTLAPTPFFGAAAAPFPKNAMVYGYPGTLNTFLDADNAYCYGVTWTKFLQIDPIITMNSFPNNRSKIGDCVMAFSLDIPYGQVLRGIDIFFSTAVSGLMMNPTGYGMPNNTFDWGQGALSFPLMNTGSPDYTLIYYLMVATDPLGTSWTTVPSIGADSAMVTGSGIWKTITFSALDFETLLDVNGNPLLQGSRRTHFTVVLASELTGVSMTGLSYNVQNVPKK